MPKTKFKPDNSPDPEAILDPAATTRRVRNLSYEICFALVLTAVAVASIVGLEGHHGDKTASVEAHQAANPALLSSAKSR